MDEFDSRGYRISDDAVLRSVRQQVEDPASVQVMVDGYHQYEKKQKPAVIVVWIMTAVFTILPTAIAIFRDDSKLMATVLLYNLVLIPVMWAAVGMMLRRLQKRVAQPFFLYATYCRRNPTQKPEIRWTEQREMVILNMPPKPKACTAKNVVIWLLAILLALFLMRGRILEFVETTQRDAEAAETANQWQETKDNLQDMTDRLEKTKDALDDIQVPDVPVLKIPQKAIP